VRNGNIGVSTTHPYTKIIGELTSYADGRSYHDKETNEEEKCYFDLNDKEWYDKAITNLTSGFNHFKNYHKLRQLNSYNGKSIKITNSFLVIESTNDKIDEPFFETVDELKGFLVLKHLLD